MNSVCPTSLMRCGGVVGRGWAAVVTVVVRPVLVMLVDAAVDAAAVNKPAAAKRRGIVNETGVPPCLELLQPAGEMGAGAGVARRVASGRKSFGSWRARST